MDRGPILAFCRRALCGLLPLALLIGTAVAADAPNMAQNAGAGGSGGAPPGSLRVLQPDGDELLILRLTLNTHVLSEGLAAYQTGDQVCLSLGEVVRALEFPIEVDAGAGRAEGWFLKEDRTFALDVKQGKAVIAGVDHPFERSRVHLYPGTICVASSLLSEWFPVAFTLDRSNSLMGLKSREPLPIEQRLARERHRARILRGSGKAKDYPKVEIPYRAWSWPVVDIFADSRVVKRGDTDNTHLEGQYDVLAVGDLMYMNSDIQISGNEAQPVSRVRARIGRKDPSGGLLGPLRATEFTLGDVATPQTSLVARSTPGRGGEISSFPLDQPEEFDRTTLRGPLPIGWEVELYRSGVLLDFQVSRGDGRYEFRDVPMLYGRNQLRLVFYGPQGQVREDTREIFVGLHDIPAGASRFRLAINQQNTDIITSSSPAVDDENTGHMRFVAQYEAGLTKALSIHGGVFNLPIDGQQKGYLNLGLGSILAGFSTRLDASMDDKGGTAGELAVQGRVGGIDLFAQHAQFFDFESEQAEAVAGDRLANRSMLRANSILGGGSGRHLPVSLTAKHEQRDSGRHELELSNRVSTAYQRLSVTNEIKWMSDFGGAAPDVESLDDTFRLNYYLAPLTLRGTFNTNLHPDVALKDAALTADWKISADTTARFGFTHQVTEDLTTVSAGLNKRFKAFDVGWNASVGNDGSYAVGVSFTLSLGHDPRSGTWRASPDHRATTGLASAHVYLDDNMNGRFDEGEEPLKGVQFMADQHQRKVATGDDGTALIDDLPVYKDVEIAVSRGIEDPYMVPGVPGYSVATRPGVPATIEFPIVRTGEVDGTIRWAGENTDRGIPSVELELLTAAGKIVKTTKTAFDGFYLFELVPLGRYVLRISPVSLRRLSLRASPPVAVTLTKDAPVAQGRDLTLARQEPTASGNPSPSP